MKTKYIVTKHETIKRTEKVQYVVSIPERIKNKEEYANSQLKNSDYISCKAVDILDSDLMINATVQPMHYV